MTTQDVDTAPVDTAPVDTAPVDTAAIDTAPVDTAPLAGHRRGRVALVSGLLVVAAAAGGATAYSRASAGDHLPAAVASARHAAAPPVEPAVSLVGAQPDGSVAWRGPLVVAAAAGTLTAVTGTDASGGALAGELAPDGRWTSSTALFPSSAYRLQVQVRRTTSRIKLIINPNKIRLSHKVRTQLHSVCH